MSDLFMETRPIKALSLWQPWASLVAYGANRHETRHWSTDYRGPIAIHAAKTLDMAGSPDELCRCALGHGWTGNLPRGCVVAVGRLTAVRPAHEIADSLTRADRAAGNYAHGRFAWEISDVRPLAKPIPVVGRQGLFNWAPPDDLDERVFAIRDHAAICRGLGWG